MIIKRKLFSNPHVRKATRDIGKFLVDGRNTLRKSFRLRKPTVQDLAMDRALVDSGNRAVENLSIKLSRLVPGSNKQTREIARRRLTEIKELPKKGIEATKSSLSKEELAKKADKIISYGQTHTPGQISEEIGGLLTKAPVATVGTAAGYAMVPITNIYIPGTTAMSVGLQEAINKAAPGSILSGGLYPVYERPIADSVSRGARNIVYKAGKAINSVGNRLIFKDIVPQKKLARASVKVKQSVHKNIPIPKNIAPKHVVHGTTESIVRAFQ